MAQEPNAASVDLSSGEVTVKEIPRAFREKYPVGAGSTCTCSTTCSSRGPTPWGKDTVETRIPVREEMDDEDVKVLTIGGGGENLFLYAKVMTGIKNATPGAVPSLSWAADRRVSKRPWPCACSAGMCDHRRTHGTGAAAGVRCADQEAVRGPPGPDRGPSRHRRKGPGDPG